MAYIECQNDVYTWQVSIVKLRKTELTFLEYSLHKNSYLCYLHQLADFFKNNFLLGIFAEYVVKLEAVLLHFTRSSWSGRTLWN